MGSGEIGIIQACRRMALEEGKAKFALECLAALCIVGIVACLWTLTSFL